MKMPRLDLRWRVKQSRGVESNRREGTMSDSTAHGMIAGMTDQYLGPAGVAARIGVAPATVRGYAAQGKMPPADVKIDANSGWSEETIEAWIASRPGRGVRTPAD